jgi:hypothetical protein
MANRLSIKMTCTNYFLPFGNFCQHRFEYIKKSATCYSEDIVIYATWQKYGNVFCFNILIIANLCNVQENY